MSDQIFFEKQFALKGIPKGSGKYEDFVRCQRVIGLQSKLSPTLYQEMLGIAREYCGV